MIQNQWALEDLLHMENTFLSVRTRQSTLQCSWAPGGRMGVWLIGWMLGIWIQYQVLTWPVLPIPIPVILLDIFYSACFRCMFSFPKTLFDTIQWTTSWTLRLETKYWSYLVSTSVGINTNNVGLDPPTPTSRLTSCSSGLHAQVSFDKLPPHYPVEYVWGSCTKYLKGIE